MALNILPNSGQVLDDTRVPIRNNFTFIDTGFSVDHVTLNSGADEGKHKTVSMPRQPSFSAPGGTELKIGNLLYSQTAQSELHIQRAGLDKIPFTAGGENTTAPNNGSTGFTWLPSGILMKFATFEVGSASGSFDANTFTGPNFLLIGGGNYRITSVQFTPITNDQRIWLDTAAGGIDRATGRIYFRSSASQARFMVLIIGEGERV